MEIDQNQLASWLGQGGFSAALLFLLWKVGQRAITALDRLTNAVIAHHQTDTAHHNEVANDIAEIKGHLGIHAPKPRLTPPVGQPLIPAKEGE